jgi:FKBP-type peptidyl-prolyl cis-trans isomerase
MATTTGQRVGIWVIAIVLTVGTLAGFVAMILAPQNEASDSARLQKAQQEYQAAYADYQTKVDAQAAELSKKYYAEFSKYKDIPAPFKAADVKKLTTRDLKAGTGEVIKEDTAYSAYYIGWNPQGKVFDQSLDGNKLKAPIEGGNLIQGWNEGVVGMKVGGVREFTIPSDKAYGEQGSGEDIPANTPIKFIVMIIPKPESISQPEIPEELLQAYGG